MSFKLVIRQKAKNDIFAVFRWYKAQHPGLEEEWLGAVDAAMARIAQYPFAYPVVYKEVRRMVINRFPYHLFFTVQGKTVRVLNCLHARRDPDSP